MFYFLLVFPLEHIYFISVLKVNIKKATDFCKPELLLQNYIFKINLDKTYILRFKSLR